MRLPKTLNIQVGKKLRDQLREDIMKEVFKAFNLLGVVAVQVAYDVIRVTFSTNDGFRQAKELSGVRLFGLWCPILGGGPPVTIVHVFSTLLRKITPMFLLFLKTLVKSRGSKIKPICLIVISLLILVLCSWSLIVRFLGN